ncbi:hypothetical protein Tco_1362235 [Tanacetum coccineum]
MAVWIFVAFVHTSLFQIYQSWTCENGILIGPLKEEVYVAHQSDSLILCVPDKVYRLRKSSIWIETSSESSGGNEILFRTSDPPNPHVAGWQRSQDCTAMSSAEAEYVALSASCAQVMWMRTQLQDYGFNYNKIPLYCDSQSAIAISRKPRTAAPRHSSIHTRTENTNGDMFTKALPEERFQYLVRPNWYEFVVSQQKLEELVGQKDAIVSLGNKMRVLRKTMVKWRHIRARFNGKSIVQDHLCKLCALCSFVGVVPWDRGKLGF